MGQEIKELPEIKEALGGGETGQTDDSTSKGQKDASIQSKCFQWPK